MESIGMMDTKFLSNSSSANNSITNITSEKYSRRQMMLGVTKPKQNINEARLRIESINKLEPERQRFSEGHLHTSKERRKFLFNGMEQALEEQIFQNMSVHNLKVRWIQESDMENGLKDLIPIDKSRSNAEVLGKMQ